LPLPIGQTAPDFRANVNPVINAVLLLFFIISTTSAPALAGHDNSSDNGNAQLLTVTLQKMDISVSPVDQPFNVTLSIHKDTDNNVTIKIPSITQTFNSSGDGPNFISLQPPKLRFSSFPGQPPADYSYPLLPPDYPLGGYIDTVFNAIPVEFRPTGALPVTFVVGSKIIPGLNYMGFIDNQGRLQFSGLDETPLGVGNFATSPTSVTYRIGERPDVDLRNFRISLGPSDAAKSNPADFPNRDQETSLHWDYADWDADTLRGFLNGTYYRAWTDNSAALPYNNKNQRFMSYAVAKIKVKNFGKTFAIEGISNLSRGPGGEDLDPNFTYGEGGVAIDPTNNLNLAADYQQRKASRIGFVLSRSFDGGKTWTKKLLGLPAADPNDPQCGWLKGVQPAASCQPLDPNLPIGGDDVRVGFDRFGGLWLTYLTGTAFPGAGFFGGPLFLVYSADKGETFTLILNEGTSPTQVPDNIRPFYQGFDYDNLGIGPDATNLSYDTVWMSVGDAITGCAPNEYQQRFWGFRIKGLGVKNIDLSCPSTPDGNGCTGGSLKGYIIPSSQQAGFTSIDLDPKGAVIVALLQTNPKGTFLEQVQNNTRSWVNVLEHGLADDSFSEKREFALTANGECQAFPPTPHNAFLRPGTALIAVDKSNQHPGRIYAVYVSRPDIYSDANKPYLIWSDDRGLTWSNPITVSTDKSSATAMLPTVAVDPGTGVVAVSWGDTRGSITNTKMNRYGVFLDPRELN